MPVYVRLRAHLQICVCPMLTWFFGPGSIGWLGWLHCQQRLWPGVGPGETGLNPPADDSCIYRAPSRT